MRYLAAKASQHFANLHRIKFPPHSIFFQNNSFFTSNKNFTGFQFASAKTAVLVWKCVHDKAPRYLADLCIPVTSVEGRRQLRSATTGTLLLLRAAKSCPELGPPLVSGASRCSAPQPGTVYLLRYAPPNCR